MDRKRSPSDLTIRWKPTPAMVSAYGKAIVGFVGAVKGIPDDRKGELHELLWTTLLMRGFDMAMLTEELVARFGLSLREAAAMSQHQCSLARVVMENARRLDIGIKEAVWLHAGAPCEGAPDHAALNGRRYKVESGVTVDGKQIWPGMEAGCKCSSKAVIAGFEDD